MLYLPGCNGPAGTFGEPESFPPGFPLGLTGLLFPGFPMMMLIGEPGPIGFTGWLAFTDPGLSADPELFVSAGTSVCCGLEA